MAKKTVTLEPNEGETVAFETTPTVAKTYHVSVDGLSGSFVAIAPPIFDPWSYDFNGDGIIDTNEMLAAVNDQAAGIITPEQVKQVIALWETAPPIFDPWSYDFNGDGVIDTNEMLAAVNDQAAGIITPEQVKQVIALWGEG